MKLIKKYVELGMSISTVTDIGLTENENWFASRSSSISRNSATVWYCARDVSCHRRLGALWRY
jgi:hypothetical protein